MPAAKMIETSAERYRRIKAERMAKEELFDFESPSGMAWKLRKPDIPMFVTLGVLPMRFASKLADATKVQNGDNKAAFESLNWDDQVRVIELSNKIVRYCAVEPRIVENPTGPNEIGFDEVELDDYTAIAQWATPSGGEVPEGLDTFRGE